MAVQSWTEAEIDTLRAMAAAGRPSLWIAAKLRRSENNIRVQGRKLGLSITRYGSVPRIHNERNGA